MAFRAELYGTPTSPVLEAHASVGAAGEITILQFDVAVPEELPRESTTCAVKLNVPAAVGVPVMAPVFGFSVRPSGNTPAEIANVYGGNPPLADRAEV